MDARVFDRTNDRVQRSVNLSENDGQHVSVTETVRIDGLIPLEMSPEDAKLFTEENRIAGLNCVLAEQDWPILGRTDLKMIGLFLSLSEAERELAASLA